MKEVGLAVFIDRVFEKNHCWMYVWYVKGTSKERGPVEVEGDTKLGLL